MRGISAANVHRSWTPGNAPGDPGTVSTAARRNQRVSDPDLHSWPSFCGTGRPPGLGPCLSSAYTCASAVDSVPTLGVWGSGVMCKVTPPSTENTKRLGKNLTGWGEKILDNAPLTWYYTSGKKYIYVTLREEIWLCLLYTALSVFSISTVHGKKGHRFCSLIEIAKSLNQEDAFR